ncbi:tetratricopeptide repeat protein [Saccharopolyspora hattusasensis]|uniref:tetratricopeptide repeat protein n=1 Tax=Saccharopolyspora hattusasensis TaxID=1128679 RepID=UPI003D961315
MPYETLPDPAKRLYRRLGDHPSRYFTAAAADAMLDPTDRATTESALENLQASGMASDHHTCYSMPHAIQEHARTLANHDDQHTRKAAQARVIALAYLPDAVDADYALNPRPPRYNPAYEELRSGARTSRFGHPREAMTWFTTHLGTLRGLLHQAHEHENHIAVCDLAEASWGAILKARLNRYLVESHELAVVSARECGSPAESILTTRLSWGYRRTDRITEAITTAITARRIAIKAGDDWAESTAWSAEGRAYQAAEEYHDALERFLKSLAIAERLGDSRSIALTLRHIAECHTAQRRYAEACEYLENAAARMDTIGDKEGYAGVLVTLAAPRIANGQAALALDDMFIALEIMRDSGSDAYVGDVLASAGDAAAALGHTSDARQHYTQAHDLFAAVDDTTNADRMTAALAAL